MQVFVRSLLVGIIALSISFCRGAEIIFDFTEGQLNKGPKGFESVVGGEGKPGEWHLVMDEVPAAIPTITSKAATPRKMVLAQLSKDPTDEHFPMLIYTNEVFGDFTFSTRFKTVAGEVEQMAGLVFRYQDENNYYYVRASAKGNTFRFFKIVGGQRSAPIGPDIPIETGVWHDMSVQCIGNQILCFLNGKQVIPTATDNSFSAGKLGFWTKSDSVSHFTDAKVVYTPRVPLARVLLKELHQKYPRVLAMRIYSHGKDGNMQVMASTRDEELGKAGGKTETEVLEKNSPFFGRLKRNQVVVTLPLHDRNGEVIAALRVELKSFFGETENNAVARALPIAQEMERRISGAKDLF
ncbi:MAG: family 16 glycoside hydrolase [Verrucomicrobiales bacterium]